MRRNAARLPLHPQPMPLGSGAWAKSIEPGLFWNINEEGCITGWLLDRPSLNVHRRVAIWSRHQRHCRLGDQCNHRLAKLHRLTHHNGQRGKLGYVFGGHDPLYSGGPSVTLHSRGINRLQSYYEIAVDLHLTSRDPS
jgi:hypothetical protein